MKITQEKYTEEKYGDYKVLGVLFLYGKKRIILPYGKSTNFVGVFAYDKKKKDFVLLDNFNCKMEFKLDKEVKNGIYKKRFKK